MEKNDPEAEAEVKAFFALNRKTLYLGALTVVVNILLLFISIGFLTMKGMGSWIIPLIPFNLLIYTLLLVKSPEGRGCLRTIGLGYGTRKVEPRNQVRISLILTVIGILIALANGM